ncbi:unnamed protein product [Sphagnum tenellum]
MLWNSTNGVDDDVVKDIENDPDDDKELIGAVGVKSGRSHEEELKKKVVAVVAFFLHCLVWTWVFLLERSPMDKEMQWVQDEVGLLLEATLKENVTEEVVKKIGTPVKVYQEAQQKFGLLQETLDSDMNCGEKTEAKGGVGFAPEPAPDKCIAEEVVKKLNPVKITQEAFKKDKDMEAQKKMNLPQDTAGTFRFSQQAPGGVMPDDEGKLAQENCVLAAQKNYSLGDVAECAHRPLYPHLEFHEKAVEKKADNMQAAEEDVSEKEMSRAKSKPYTQLAAQGKEAVGMEDKAKEMKDPNELLVWPPTVVIENTRTGKTEDGRWTGIGNVEMACFLKDIEHAAGKPKSTWGKEGHKGQILVQYPPSLQGLEEADRLHEDFEKNGRSRKDWCRIQPFWHGLPGHDDLEEGPDFLRIDKETQIKQRVFYGYLATAADLDKVQQPINRKRKRKVNVLTRAQIQAHSVPGNKTIVI